MMNVRELLFESTGTRVFSSYWMRIRISFIIYPISIPDMGIYWNKNLFISRFRSYIMFNVQCSTLVFIFIWGKRDVCALCGWLASCPICVTSFVVTYIIIIIIYKYDNHLTSFLIYLRCVYHAANRIQWNCDGWWMYRFYRTQVDQRAESKERHSINFRWRNIARFRI